MRELFKQRNFRLLFIALVTSTAGDWLMVLVFGIWVKSLTGSNGAAGLTIFFVALPSLVAPLFGFVIDKFRRRLFLIAASLISAAMLLPIVILPESVWLINLTAVGYGISGILLSGATNGLLKELLTEEELADANGALQTAKQGLRLAGPLVGAGLFTLFGGSVVAIIDIATFIVAGAAIALIRVDEEKPVHEPQHWFAEVSAGGKFLFAEPALRRAVTTYAAAFLAMGMVEVLGYAVVEALGKPPTFVSILVTAMGAGAIVGGLVASAVVKRIGELGTIGCTLVIEGLCLLLLTNGNLFVVLAGMAVLGVASPIGLVADMTLLQKRTPLELMGRVSTSADAMITLPQTLSIAMGAALIATLDYRLLLVVVAAMMVLCGLYALAGKGLTPPVFAVRKKQQLDDEVEEPRVPG